MNQTKKFTITLSEDDVVALANLHITLTENQEGLESITDMVDGPYDTNPTVWTCVQSGIEALRALLPQLPM